MWAEMRARVIAAFPSAPGAAADIDALLKDVEARYVTDAYHSLSIEGYRVSPTLIQKVRDASWNPDADAQDRAMRDAMAARGYFEAHELVKESLVRALEGATGRNLDAWANAWVKRRGMPVVSTA